MSHRSRNDSTGSTMDSTWPGIAPTLNDKQWNLIADLFPEKKVGPSGGRPRVNNRACFEGILWVLRSGARWKDLPSQYPSYPTCWRRFAKWSLEGIWDIAIERLLQQLDLRHQLDWSEGFADATFASAKKGGIASATHERGKGARSWSFPTAMDSRWPSTLNRQTLPKLI